ncbi:hypothetical protein WJX75_000943 [Coccomyxa subellipsoidea]|uniref:Uncharacterized protein n=1 Tax=Coccomyxa subellipsoidea TaxID=248742 RepID=A0ABR2YSV5_9CHLO
MPEPKPSKQVALVNADKCKQRIECDVLLAAPMSSWQAAYVAEEVLKHLLFMRNMIPSLFNDLAEKVVEDHNMESDPITPQRKDRRPGGQRKVEKVLRSLIINTAAVPEGKASVGATKLFLVLQAPEQEVPPAGFLPKRGFQLRQRKGLQVQIQLGTPQDNSSAVDAVEACTDMDNGTTDAGDQSNLIWYQCTTSLKSLTTVSSNPTGISGFM